MSWLTSWLVPHLLPYVLSALVPIVVAGVRKALEAMESKLPTATLLAVAAILGEVVAQIPAMVSDIPGLPPGMGGAFAVFVREIVDQVQKVRTGSAKRIG